MSTGARIDIAAAKLNDEAPRPVLEERGRRCLAAAEAPAAGWGGIAAARAATGIARGTIVGYGGGAVFHGPWLSYDMVGTLLKGIVYPRQANREAIRDRNTSVAMRTALGSKLN